MHTLRKTWLTAALVIVICGSVGLAQQLNMDQVIDRIVQREHDEIKMLSQYDPIIEIYVQENRADQQPSKELAIDRYLFGEGDCH